jgi:iron-sulfur cluster repair protein YtfE (RIC family)
MKATAALAAQHRDVLARFERLRTTADPTERRRLLDELVDALAMHAELEEEVFYPAIREGAGAAGDPATDALVLDAIEQHHVVDLLLAEAPDLDPEAESFPAKVKVLHELVARHVELEERELFALAAALAADDAEDLDRRLEAETAPAS